LYVITHHFTLLASQPDGKRLAQIDRVHTESGLAPLTFSRTEIETLNAEDGPRKKGALITSGPLAGYTYFKGPGPDTFHLWQEQYVCAPTNLGPVTADRTTAAHWETFHLIDPAKAPAYLGIPSQREAAFVARVQELRQTTVPILLHFGCGRNRLPGFLNIDKFLNFGEPTDYFRFDYAEKPWPLPDESVDYVYSEDFIEHIPQRNQVGFLAEAFRVLKPGAFNRVSTPCLADSMKRNSDFGKGMAGVHFEEFDKWGHTSLFTRGLMIDLADAIGYRHVFFTAKNRGSSPHALDDDRPLSDRDAIMGNLFADLMK
jgi:Methyltransferase domain